MKTHELLHLFTLCLRVLLAWSVVIALWMGVASWVLYLLV